MRYQTALRPDVCFDCIAKQLDEGARQVWLAVHEPGAEQDKRHDRNGEDQRTKRRRSAGTAPASRRAWQRGCGGATGAGVMRTVPRDAINRRIRARGRDRASRRRSGGECRGISESIVRGGSPSVWRCRIGQRSSAPTVPGSRRAGAGRMGRRFSDRCASAAQANFRSEAAPPRTRQTSFDATIEGTWRL